MELQETLAAADRVFEVLGTKSTVVEQPEAVTIKRATGRVVFEHVSFSYLATNERLALDDIDLEVEPGEAIALVGPSGAGKTTLISLLIRLYDPTEGRIRLDNIDLRYITVASLRQQLSVVLQQPLLVGGTVTDNIRFGALDPGRVSMEEVTAAARSANAHDFIMRLPKQYDTVLDEQGMSLSVGEVQHIAIARAFLRSSPILILDEPTSAQDEASEHLVLEALQHLTYGCTTFIVSHRPAPLLHADRAVRLKQGRIVSITSQIPPESH
jgi:ABC-type multidrug transport system fused ATPase/permease subunit